MKTKYYIKSLESGIIPQDHAHNSHYVAIFLPIKWCKQAIHKTSLSGPLICGRLTNSLSTSSANLLLKPFFRESPAFLVQSEQLQLHCWWRCWQEMGRFLDREQAGLDVRLKTSFAESSTCQHQTLPVWQNYHAVFSEDGLKVEYHWRKKYFVSPVKGVTHLSYW